ncbi:hypothetical protein N0V93_003897 [Gnomoniopsis smithogilvyi]|uniref:Uncharacterized protein n=1 Tax=Gnomoniopsis smithogilvyi TaxID=1191159 RepID=A0A9W9D0G7_9PEZI|nr:hypothetical protein N0V93_003897 [Gnomoniopsis smithogilvyi]
MSANHSYASPPTPANTMSVAPLVLAIRTREPQVNASPKKKTPVIVHTESLRGDAVPVKEIKKEVKEEVAVPAVTDRFSAQYGVNFTGLEPWVRLCRDLGVQGPLNSKTQCKKALANIRVNIRDFLDAIDARASTAACYVDPVARDAILNNPLGVRFFDSEWSLAAYTLANHRVYSRREIRANQEHPLRLLMAHIRSPRGRKARRGAIGC